MSALAELFDILHEEIPQGRPFSDDEVVDLLRQHITEPVPEALFQYYQLQDGDWPQQSDTQMPSVKDLSNMEDDFYSSVGVVQDALRDLIQPDASDSSDEVIEFITNSWNALYNDLHGSVGGRASQRRNERKGRR